MSEKISRRLFIKEIGLIGGIALAGLPFNSKASDKIPKRVLGRTGVQVSTLALGMGPLGINSNIQSAEVDELVSLCIDMGINYIDVAPNYGNGEEKLAPLLKKRREEVFLVSKVEESSKDGALRQVSESLNKMQTAYLDAVHLHNFGGFDTEAVLGKDGALAGLMEARKSGLIKFIGISGHEQPAKFLKAIETDEIDLVMTVLNFVDRHTYNFENILLPEAKKRKAGIAAMKVLGGAVGMQYDKPMPALLPKEHYTSAIRYSLGLPGVATLVIGLKNREEILQAVEAVRNYEELSDDEKLYLDKTGRELAEKWGAHFGPVS